MNKMKSEARSYCPMNLAVEIFGDKWTLLIIRDLIIEDKRRFREFLNSDEGIATNILTDRLSMLERRGILIHRPDPTHKQKKIYCLTQMGIDLFPVLLSIAEWSCKYLPVDSDSASHAQALLSGGNALKDRLIKDLQEKHLNA